MLRQDVEPRIYFDKPVELVLEEGGTVISGRGYNLSPGGLFVRAPVLVPSATTVHVRFTLDDGIPIVAEATVLRCNLGEAPDEPPGMAVRFDHMEDECAWRLAVFIDARLQPARGESVRLQLGSTSTAVRARTQSSWNNYVSVDADLPFLQLGTNVNLDPGAPMPNNEGQIRWVSVHVCPETGVPRLNIGIELDMSFDETQVIAEEEQDPVCTAEFATHAQLLDEALGVEREPDDDRLRSLLSALRSQA